MKVFRSCSTTGIKFPLTEIPCDTPEKCKISSLSFLEEQVSNESAHSTCFHCQCSHPYAATTAVLLEACSFP